MKFFKQIIIIVLVGSLLIAGRDGTSDSLMRYADSDADPKYLLKLNGHDRFAARPVTYFTQTKVWEHHTGYGAVNNPDSIAVYSFALKPEEHQPSGTCNFSRIDNAQLTGAYSTDNSDTLVEQDGGKVYVYAVNYNVLRIMSGMGGLAYSN